MSTYVKGHKPNRIQIDLKRKQNINSSKRAHVFWAHQNSSQDTGDSAQEIALPLPPMYKEFRVSKTLEIRQTQL